MDSGKTQIMIDGVRMYDPIAPNGAFDLAHFTLDNVERIEVVNGPQSVLYGSDAMGGVINIITKKGAGKPTTTFLTSGGTYNSHTESLESSGKVKDLSYSFGFSRFDTDGISKLRNTSERDPYDNTSFSLRVDYDINPQNTVGFISRYTNSRFKYDDSNGLRDDPDLIGKEQQLYFSNYFESRINDIWQQKLQLSYMANYRRDADDLDPQFPSNYLRDWYKGTNYQADWQHNIKVTGFDSVIAGIDYQREAGSYYYFSQSIFGPFEAIFPEKTTNTKGYYLQNLINIQDVFHLNTGIRFDDHSNFGLHQTYKVDSNYLFKTGTKIKGGWGTAFKAPTIYQLHAIAHPYYGGGGNANLKPEESSTYELGAEQNILEDKICLGLTYFHTNVRNLIDAIYHPDTYFTDNYANVGKARIFGYESTMTIKPVKELKFDVGYAWQHTQNRETGDELLRRPQNKCFWKIRYTPMNNLEFGIKFNYVGKRQDSGNRPIKAYNRVDLDASYKLNVNTEVFASINNVTSESYEELKGYAEPGRTFLGGLKFTF